MSKKKRIPHKYAFDTAAQRLVSTVEATGGLVQFLDGTLAPAGDLDWVDLADAYVQACRELRRRPMVRKFSYGRNG